VGCHLEDARVRLPEGLLEEEGLLLLSITSEDYHYE
jgi:hypothetical protein